MRVSLVRKKQWGELEAYIILKGEGGQWASVSGGKAAGHKAEVSVMLSVVACRAELGSRLSHQRSIQTSLNELKPCE